MNRTRAELANPNCEVTDSDYDAIVAAIMETSRGRWFLSEYARRNRHADTELLLTSMHKIRETLDRFATVSRPYLIETKISADGHANQPMMPLAPGSALKPLGESETFDFRMLKRASA